MDFCEGKGGICLCWEVCKDSCVMSWCHLVFSIIQISWSEWPTISMKWGLERWWVMMMMWWSVCGSEISCDEWGYVSMLGGLCEDWCDVVMPLSFLYNSNFMKWMTNYLYEMRFGEMMGDDDDVMKCVWEWNFMWWMGVCVYVGRFVWGLVWCRDAT